MRAGRLDRRITVNDPVETQSGTGEVTTVYSPAAAIGAGDGRVWAAIEPLAGNKFFAADQVQATTTHVVRVRYQPGYRTNQRLDHEVEPGVVEHLTVDAVLRLKDDKRHIDLMCTLRETAGIRS